MDALTAKNIIEAIRRDDLPNFNRSMQGADGGALRYGRFPVLSIMYLYGAKKIIAAHEAEFIKINKYEQTDEPLALSTAFAAAAGKCLRLYHDEVVSPLEMLLILDNGKKVKKLYPLAPVSAAVKQRLKDIYNIKYSLDVSFSGKEIVLEKRPRTKREFKKLVISCTSIALAAVIAISTPFVVNAFVPFIGKKPPEVVVPPDDKPVTPPDDTPENPDGSQIIEIATFDEVNFNTTNVYRLTEDVVLPADYCVANMYCAIDGNGKTVTLTGDMPFINTLHGTIANMNFVTNGRCPVIGALNYSAVVDSVVVDVTVDTTVDTSYGFLTFSNHGVIQNVTVNVSGNINFAPEEGVADEDQNVALAGIAYSNVQAYAFFFYYVGVINSCTVNLDNLTLSGEYRANASFAGICAYNNGKISYCLTEGSATANTVDLAGVTVTNDYSIAYCKNGAALTQRSAEPMWNPVVAGIVISAQSEVSWCINTGALTAASTCEQGEQKNTVSVGGIAASTLATVHHSVNSGNMRAEGTGYVYAGGIVCHVNTRIESYVYLGIVESCIANAEIALSCNAGDYGFAGGIAANVSEVGVNGRDGEITYYGGGIKECYFTGEINAQNVKSGGIAGVCGKNIYENNLISFANEEFINFENNLFAGEMSATAAIAYLEEQTDGEQTTYITLYGEGGDTGAQKFTKDEIERLKTYREIMAVFADK